jgi:hypothetical protein
MILVIVLKHVVIHLLQALELSKPQFHDLGSIQLMMYVITLHVRAPAPVSCSLVISSCLKLDTSNASTFGQIEVNMEKELRTSAANAEQLANKSFIYSCEKKLV